MLDKLLFEQGERGGDVEVDGKLRHIKSTGERSLKLRQGLSSKGIKEGRS